MTIRQLYYTSCQRGKEGIRGFQVNAASAGLPERHEDLGLQLSAYRPSPSAPVLPTPEQIENFPIAVGYRSFDEVAVLFHSRYLGTDFTGRQGNYFAHVLILDAPEADLAGMLPIEAWESSLWTWQPSQETQLPLVGAISPGPLADPERIRAHVLASRLPEFAVMLSAVQEGLSGRVDRVVIVAADAGDVARAIAAITYSLPPALARAVSFTTFTSSPADANVLLVGTTPDVEIASSPYGDQLVVTLGESSGGETTSRYARALGERWMNSVAAVREVVTLASRVSPPLEGGELDQFADLVELAVPASSSAVPALLAAVEFGLRRLPSVLTGALWQRVDAEIRRVGCVEDVERWSAVFAAISRSGATPGPELESAYMRAALSQIADGVLDPASIWLPDQASGRRQETALDWALGRLKASPQLDSATRVLGTLDRLGIPVPDTELQLVVDEVVLPALLHPSVPDAISQLRKLPQAHRLLLLSGGQLESRLASDDELFDTVVEDLSPEAADLLDALARPGPRCAAATAFARARNGRTDRVSTLVGTLEAPAAPEAVERFVGLLWPSLPTAAEGVRLLRSSVDKTVLGATTIPQQMVERLIEDAHAGGLTSEHAELAELLAIKPFARSLANAVDTVDSVLNGVYFDIEPPLPEEATRATVETIKSAAGADEAVAGWALRALARWMLSLTDSRQHAEILLEAVKASTSPRFLTAYCDQLSSVLSSARPVTIAAILPAVVSFADNHRAARQLLDITCQKALARRSKRDLDAIGRSFQDRKRKRAPLLPTPGKGTAKDWPSWWKDWRERNLPKSTLARLLRRLTPGGDD
jgi:GTPase-associated protein 1, N-terminal domain type 2/GTPase-associated protein 1, middle domain